MNPSPHRTQDCLEAVGPQPQKTKIAHNKEHKTVLWDSTGELFCSISNISVQCCCLSCTTPSGSTGSRLPQLSQHCDSGNVLSACSSVTAEELFFN